MSDALNDKVPRKAAMSARDYDDGIMRSAIKGYATARGIGYEEAKSDMVRFRELNPPPEDAIHRRGDHADRTAAREHWNWAREHFQVKDPQPQPYSNLEPRYYDDDLEPAF